MLLEVDKLTKEFDKGKPVVNRISFQLHENEIFALLGPSGCGKTTTLRLIAGFESPNEGKIKLYGRMLSAHGKHVAPQERPVEDGLAVGGQDGEAVKLRVGLVIRIDDGLLPGVT
jgi:iron(III) transport system ATP-binding protein